MGVQQGSYQPAASGFAPVFVPSLAGELSDLAAVRTVVVKLRTSALLAIGNKLRVGFVAPVSGTLTISALYAGLAAASGNAWNFAAATQITFDGGAASKVFNDRDAKVVVSDAIDFSFDGSKALLLAMELPIGARQPLARNLGSNVMTYYKDGVSEAASTTKGSGYTPLLGTSVNIAELSAALV